VLALAGRSPTKIIPRISNAQIRCIVLCASDPYAVVGVSQSFGVTPDLISGIATSTTAGVELVEKLTGVVALTLPDHQSLPKLMQILKAKLAFN